MKKDKEGFSVQRISEPRWRKGKKEGKKERRVGGGREGKRKLELTKL